MRKERLKAEIICPVSALRGGTAGASTGSEHIEWPALCSAILLSGMLGGSY